MVNDIIARYQSGETLREIAAATGLGKSTVANRLHKAGVEMRPDGRPVVMRGSVHRVIKALASNIGAGAWALERAGLSPSWWQLCRRGSVSPSIDNLEALANAAGYEIVLRRRGG